jgi:hypothetical protein
MPLYRLPHVSLKQKKEGIKVDILEAKAGICEMNDVHDEVSHLPER